MKEQDSRLNQLASLDPRAKLFIVVLFALQILMFDSAEALGACLIIILVKAAAAGISPVRLALHARKVFWFVLFIVGINMLTKSGVVLFRVGDLFGTWEGLIVGIRLSIKVILLYWSALIFVYSTPPERIVAGIETLLFPIRKYSGPLQTVLTITLNFVPSLIQIAQHIRLSYLARGFDIESGLVQRLRYIAAAEMPLFRSAWRMSEHLALAMEARCYDTSQDRTLYPDLTFQTRDTIFVASALLLFGGLALLDYHH